MANTGWIGVDFDGTLARYDGWKGDFNFGSPIMSMVERIKTWISVGWNVKIMTARASEYKPEDRAEVVKALQAWCMEHIGYKLEVTNAKDYAMIQLWDDRAVQVLPNTGIVVQEELEKAHARILRLEGALRGALGHEADQILKDLEE